MRASLRMCITVLGTTGLNALDRSTAQLPLRGGI